MADVKTKCSTLEAEQQGMKKKVNPKVLSMIDRCVSVQSPPTQS